MAQNKESPTVVAVRTSILSEALWLDRCTSVGEVAWMEGGWSTQWKDLNIKNER